MGPSPARPSPTSYTTAEAAATVCGQETDLGEQLIGRARAAHQAAATAADTDAAYLIGERNAYAEAAGLALAHGVESLSYAIANRITDDLADHVTDLDELLHRAQALPRAEALLAASTPPAPEWMGPLAFTRRFAGYGVDEDFGSTWGPHRDQRISHRHLPGVDDGLLYAYDPIWREYAVLEPHASLRSVREEYTHVLGIDPHQPVTAFAAGVAARTHRALEPAAMEVEL